MPVTWTTIGGSKGRGPGVSCAGNLKNAPSACRIPMSFSVVKTNDWYYVKGNVSSTTGGAVTGGALSARKRRT